MAIRLSGHQPFVRYFAARTVSEFAYQMAGVAVGWQVYALTRSALALGLIGLTQFVPSALLVFVAGHTADRYDRRRVVAICRVVQGLAAAYLAWGSLAGRLRVPDLFAAVVVLGVAWSFESPADAALLTGVTPAGIFQRAAATVNGAGEVASIAGPAVGGLAYALSPGVPYALIALFSLVAAVLDLTIRLERPITVREASSPREMFAGVAFVRRSPAILGTISLDLFAVLFGGVTALLPIYARDVLHTGPWGLGLLRSAPAIGALVTAALLARHGIARRAGRKMFWAVIAFGAATVVFAVSHLLWLSVLALAALGAADAVSVVVRSALVQLGTPDAMRGRVGAVHYLFVNASNQLGQFESGVTAALLGAMPAAALGGVGTIAVALLWMRLFPGLRAVDRLE
ncbi:MAG TPA: MFS transporter [Candidatus Sulfotelmatobacter sp.]|nr:MFS transporter [Candidatus Sulfotelmatobacter sp.]